MMEEYVPSEVRIGIEQKIKLETQFKRGSGWFFWIGGLSLLNALIIIFGGNLNFVIGLATTQLIQGFFIGFSSGMEPTAKIITDLISFSLIIGVAVLFVLFGILSRRRIRWVYISGMGLYALDGLIYLGFSEFIGVAFHIIALVGLYGGLKTMQKLSAIESGDFSLIGELADSKPTVKDRRYWVKLLLMPAVLLILLGIFLTFLLTYSG